MDRDEMDMDMRLAMKLMNESADGKIEEMDKEKFFTDERMQVVARGLILPHRLEQ
jgi:hypothetical protein